MFKVGQKVWDAMFGPGVVTRILTNDSSFPVGVRFDDDLGVESFTLDGKYRTCVKQTLFPYPVVIVKAVTKPSIDWSHVSPEYNYLVQDSDDEGYLCGKNPHRMNMAWSMETPIRATAFTSYVPGTCDWEDSLVERPQLKPNRIN